MTDRSSAVALLFRAYHEHDQLLAETALRQLDWIVTLDGAGPEEPVSLPEGC